jgi:hypothetical protein
VEPLANKWTPMHFAISTGKVQALAILLDHGSDVGPSIPHLVSIGICLVDNCSPHDVITNSLSNLKRCSPTELTTISVCRS